jgi:hypothetical protein
MPSDHIRESIENAKQYLSEHPDEAQYTDQPATAVIEEGVTSAGVVCDPVSA